jgi:hypothetical protein
MPRNARQNFDAAIARLRELKVYFTSPGAGHIKIGPRVNFWPTHGKIFVHGEHKGRPERGLLALEAVLRDLGYLRHTPAPNASPRRTGPTQPTLSTALDRPDPGPDADS